MGTIKTTNIEPIADNGTVTLGSSGDTFTVPSGVTVNMSSATQTGVGGANTPAFRGYLSSNQTVSDASSNKVTIDTEEYDTDNAFASSRFTVPSGKGGKYSLYANVWMRGTDVNMMNYYLLAFYKNGSNIWEQHSNFTNNDIRSFGANMSLTLNLSAGDYIEVYGRININSGNPSFGNDAMSGVPTTWFQGIKVAS